MDLDLDDRGVIRAKRRLQAFFDRDDLKRFKLERQVGEGAFGTAWKVSYRPYTEEEVRARAGDQLLEFLPQPEVPEVQHIILKTSKVAALYYKDSAIKSWPEDDDEDSQEDAPLDPFYANNSIANERRWLRKFRFSKHIVRLIEPALNPLNRKNLGLRRRLARKDYIFMEYLENGTIGDFITGINIMGGVSFVPNRFLWRCFLCLIRACIAMAWPPTEEDAEDGTSVIERAKAGDPSRIVHDDLHHFNLMFGPLVNDPNEPEHHPRIPPIKMIDFGSVFEKENQSNNLLQPTAVTDNIYSIARIMCSLIELDNLAAFMMSPGQAGPGSFEAYPGGPQMLTTATNLLVPAAPGAGPNRFPRLDPLLRATVCACAAPDPNQRPRLRSLADTARAAVRERDEHFYATVLGDPKASEESDADLEWFVNTFLLSAPVTEEQEEVGEASEVDM